MLIEDALREASDDQIKSEWARRCQAMRKTRGGGRKSKDGEVVGIRMVKTNQFIPVAEIPEFIAKGMPKTLSHDPRTCRVYKCGMCAAVKA